MSSDYSSELNLEYLQEVSGGDEEFEHEILATFLESAPELIEALQSSLASGDAPGVRHAAHTLKGSSRSIGGQPFSKVCEAVETFGKQGDLNSCQPRMGELLDSFDRLRVACESHISSALQQAA